MKTKLIFAVTLLLLQSCASLKTQENCNGDAACWFKTPLATLPAAADAIANKATSVPLFQGLTNAHAAQFAVVLPASVQPLFFFADEAANPLTARHEIASSEVQSTLSPSGKHKVYQVSAHGLKPGASYIFYVADRVGGILDRRRFHALDLGRQEARVVTASCAWDRFLSESRVMWKAVLLSKPDLAVFLGDNVYADIESEPQVGPYKGPVNGAFLWRRYIETLSELDYYRAINLVPTVATWDDHDYGANDGGAANPYREEATAVFRAFFPQRSRADVPEYKQGPGVASMLNAFGYRFLLLDNRSFRSVNRLPKPEDQTHFGREQETWILQTLRDPKNRSRPAFLFSGDQWFGGYHRFESYEGSHPANFKDFLGRVKKTGATVLFVSGDRHLTELMRIEKDILGYETFEMTSSSIHSTVYKGDWEKLPNKRQIKAADLKHNFSLFELTKPISKSKSARPTFEFKGQAIGAGSTTLFDFAQVVGQ